MDGLKVFIAVYGCVVFGDFLLNAVVFCPLAKAARLPVGWDHRPFELIRLRNVQFVTSAFGGILLFCCFKALQHFGIVVALVPVVGALAIVFFSDVIRLRRFWTARKRGQASVREAPLKMDMPTTPAIYRTAGALAGNLLGWGAAIGVWYAI